MEIFKAVVKEEEDHTYLCFIIDAEELKIPLSQDNPQAVKGVFNKLIVKLKNGSFNFEFEEGSNDLFSQVSKEYIKQLNSELDAIHAELKHNDLLEDTKEPPALKAIA